MTLRTRLMTAAMAAILFVGCSSHNEPASPSDPLADSDQAGAAAKIHINYSHPGDYLASMSVTKYSSAQILHTTTTGNGDASVVRFDGGIPVWEFAVEKNVLNRVPLIGHEERRYSPTEVKYGTLPDHFIESMPLNGPPEPLEPNHYYIFAADRGSGSISYQAVKVNGDGSLEAYEADPRAGSSYLICCNLAGDFTITAPAQ